MLARAVAGLVRRGDKAQLVLTAVRRTPEVFETSQY